MKFAGGDGAAADRWRDLLVCEHLALEVLREAGVPAPHSEWFDLDGSRYLEVDRFDRVGRQGRRGVISLYAINCHYLGDDFDNWSRASQRILEEPSLSMDAGHADRMVWLDTFGDLIGNTDRHFGNFCFFAEEARKLTLTPTPVYDMLPMVFAPTGANLVERQFAPRPPTALNLHLWHEVANHALEVLVTPLRRGRTQRRLPADFHGLPRHARPACGCERVSLEDHGPFPLLSAETCSCPTRWASQNDEGNLGGGDLHNDALPTSVATLDSPTSFRQTSLESYRHSSRVDRDDNHRFAALQGPARFPDESARAARSRVGLCQFLIGRGSSILHVPSKRPF